MVDDRRLQVFLVRLMAAWHRAVFDGMTAAIDNSAVLSRGSDGAGLAATISRQSDHRGISGG